MSCETIEMEIIRLNKDKKRGSDASQQTPFYEKVFTL